MSLTHWLLSPAWQPFLEALAHSLWQGAILAIALRFILRRVPARFAGMRYGLSVATLALLALVVVATWVVLRQTAADSPVGRLAATFAPSDHPLQDRSDLSAPFSLGETWWCWAAAGWLSGAGISLWRMSHGLFAAGTVRRRATELLDPHVLAMIEQLRTYFGLTRRVRVLVSAELGSPAVMGVVRWTLLLPTALCAGVPVEMLRAILAHELAHIRRADYLINLAQLCTEALLFFNPFVWWINRQIQTEREAACDQLAATCCPSKEQYVRALVTFVADGQRQRDERLPLPLLGVLGPKTVDGQRDGLAARLQRLLKPSSLPATVSLRLSQVFLMILLMAVLATSWGRMALRSHAGDPGKAAINAEEPALRPIHGGDGPVVVASSRIFANVPLGERHLQVIIERYTDGRQILALVNARDRQATPTRVDAVKVELYGKDGSKWQPKSILDETGTLACLDRGWRFKVAENALYDLAGMDLTQLNEVQVEVSGQESLRTPLQAYTSSGNRTQNSVAFHGEDYVYRHTPVRLYTVHLRPST